MRVVTFLLHMVSAGSASGAAWFWYLSAQSPLPPMVTYFDHAPDTDPFFAAMQAGVGLNRTAAAFAAVSALSAGLATFAAFFRR